MQHVMLIDAVKTSVKGKFIVECLAFKKLISHCIRYLFYFCAKHCD